MFATQVQIQMGVGCRQMKSRGLSLNLYFHQILIQDVSFVPLLVFAGFCFVYVVGLGGKEGNLMSEDHRFVG